MIIYDYSFQYRIKPIKVITDHVQLRDYINEVTKFEHIGGPSIRILLTVSDNEILIHFPSDVTEKVLEDVERELRRLHDKMSLFVFDTIITLDILVKENGFPDKNCQLIIIDMLSFNGVDYRLIELGTRRRLIKTFLQGLISSPNLQISQVINICDSQQEWDSAIDNTNRVIRSDIFGNTSSGLTDKKWREILIRDEKSIYNEDINDEWMIINVQTIPEDFRSQIKII